MHVNVVFHNSEFERMLGYRFLNSFKDLGCSVSLDYSRKDLSLVPGFTLYVGIVRLPYKGKGCESESRQVRLLGSNCRGDACVALRCIRLSHPWKR